MHWDNRKPAVTSELVEFAAEMFAAYRKRIDSMTDAEYAAYKRRQAERYANA